MARVARRRKIGHAYSALVDTHIGFPREMTYTPLQTHFPPVRYERGGALRASALRAEETHLRFM